LGAGFVALFQAAISISKAKAMVTALFILISFRCWFVMMNGTFYLRVIAFVSLWAPLRHTAGGKKEANNQR